MLRAYRKRDFETVASIRAGYTQAGKHSDVRTSGRVEETAGFQSAKLSAEIRVIISLSPFPGELREPWNVPMEPQPYLWNINIGKSG